MPYIGKQPLTGAYQLCDTITTSATATYNLLVGGSAVIPGSAQNCIVSLNGVVQAPVGAFTVSGSQITFASALTSSDVIDFILILGNVFDIGTPTNGSVTNASVSASAAIAYSKLNLGTSIVNADVSASAAIDATKLSAINGILLDTQTITTGSVVASVSVNSIFTTTYKTYLIIFSNIATNGSSTANNNIILQWKDTSNSTLTSNYSFVGNTQTQGGNITTSSGAFSQSSIPIVTNCFGEADTPITGYVYIFNPRSGVRTNFISQMMYHSNGGFASFKEAYSLHMANTEIGGFIISANGNATQIKGATGSGFIKTYGLL